MKYKEIKNKPKTELEKILKESGDKLLDLRFKVANRSLKNVKDINNTKKLIAKIKTVLSQKGKNK